LYDLLLSRRASVRVWGRVRKSSYVERERLDHAAERKEGGVGKSVLVANVDLRETRRQDTTSCSVTSRFFTMLRTKDFKYPLSSSPPSSLDITAF